MPQSNACGPRVCRLSASRATAQPCARSPFDPRTCGPTCSAARVCSPCTEIAGQMCADLRGGEESEREAHFPSGPQKCTPSCAVQEDVPQGQEGVTLGALEDSPQSGRTPRLCYFNSWFGGLLLPTPPNPVPKGVVVKWGTGASGSSLGRGPPGVPLCSSP